MWIVVESDGYGEDVEIQEFLKKEEALNFVDNMNRMSMALHQNSGFYVREE